MWEIGRDDKGRERRKEEKRKEERSERGREGELRAVWEGLRQGGEGKRAGMGGRRGWGKLPTAVMQLEVFLPDSRLTARVGRGRAGLHPLPPRYFRGKGMGAGPRNTKVEGGGPGSGSFPRGPDGGPFALTGKTERGSQRLGRLLPSDFLFSPFPCLSCRMPFNQRIIHIPMQHVESSPHPLSEHSKEAPLKE